MGHAMRPVTYFIDESGHSGDLASAKALDFANQPVFALARQSMRCYSPLYAPKPIARPGIMHRFRLYLGKYLS